jgi:hypothetical protein
VWKADAVLCGILALWKQWGIAEQRGTVSWRLASRAMVAMSTGE